MSDAPPEALAPALLVRDEPARPCKPGDRRRDEGPVVSGWLRWPARWLRRSRERRKLEEIAFDYPGYLLQDVGLRREDLLAEAAKPLWRP